MIIRTIPVYKHMILGYREGEEVTIKRVDTHRSCGARKIAAMVKNVQDGDPARIYFYGGCEKKYVKYAMDVDTFIEHAECVSEED